MVYYASVFRNPFGFYRKWKQIAALPPHESEIYDNYRNLEVQNQVRDLEDQLKEQRKEAKTLQKALSKQLKRMRKTQKENQKKQEESQQKSDDFQTKLLAAIQNGIIPASLNLGSAQNTNTDNVDTDNEDSEAAAKKIRLEQKGKAILKTSDNALTEEEKNDPTYQPNDSDSESSDSDASEKSIFESAKSVLSSKSTTKAPQPHCSKQSAPRSYESPPSPPAPPALNQRNRNVEAPGDIVYVQELSLKLNGDLLDQLNLRSSEDQAVFDYVRLQNTNGFINHTTTNSIEYDDFLHGYYICAFDLSTTNEGANSQYSVPSVRQGNLAVSIYFSKPPTVNLTLLMFGECTGNLSYKKN
jgi:hypothetical protein